MILEAEASHGGKKPMHPRANQNIQLSSPEMVVRFNFPLNDAPKLTILAVPLAGRAWTFTPA